MRLQYLCPVISPSSDSDDKESESDSDSGYEDEHSKEDGHDHRVNDITHNEEEIYCMEKDHYKMFQRMFFTKVCTVLQTKPNKADWKYDPDNDIGLDVLCLKEEQDHKTDLDENFTWICSLTGKYRVGSLLHGANEMDLGCDSDRDLEWRWSNDKRRVLVEVT